MICVIAKAGIPPSSVYSRTMMNGKMLITMFNKSESSVYSRVFHFFCVCAYKHKYLEWPVYIGVIFPLMSKKILADI